VTASTTTTIQGVSIFSNQRKRKADVFDIALSPEGIVIRRPGRSEQHMTWERISEWEIEERPGCVVLTLRGGGSVTPLLVKGWTLEDLETVMREATKGSAGTAAETDAPVEAGADAPASTEATADVVPDAATDVVAPVDAAGDVVAPVEAGPSDDAAGQPLAVGRHGAQRPRRGVWKPLVTVVLLGLVATAVALVLLQSAGVISWGFLGPTA